MAVDPQREEEIRRKIMRLKREGRIRTAKDKKVDDDDYEQTISRSATAAAADVTLDKLRQQRQRLKSSKAVDEYSEKLQERLGSKVRAKYLGIDTSRSGDSSSSRRTGQLGTRRGDVRVEDEDEKDSNAYQPQRPLSSFETTEFNILDPSLFETEEEEEMEDDATSEEDLIEMVAEKLRQQKQEKRDMEERERQEEARRNMQAKLNTSSSSAKTTTGVGGAWAKNETAAMETYQPKTGSWGAFPRPKDISKAYGGGRRVGAGIDETSLLQSAKDTRERLRQYREKVGIEVQSEKDHAQEIERALAVAGYAMQRGMYSQAVKALEQVTKWCSTNSKVGGKVFLELAMAYEAEGRSKEAVTVYTTLSKCRIEEIKFNAKRLLYGMEAMQFMRNDVRSSEFSRKKIRNTFIDTTGLANIAENFDDVYQTAYIDLEGGFYRRLTESVVRSNREARQILLKATGSGEVERLKIVQALRSLSRHFDSALEEERRLAAPAKEPVAVMNGRPIVSEPQEQSVEAISRGMDEFHLGSPSQMLENLNGEWRLQLLADKRGDGVKYYNTTLAWQAVDTKSMSFESSGPVGFMKISQRGDIEFEEDRRIVTRSGVETKGGMLSGLFLGSNREGQAAPQQIVSVDSVLLITRASPEKRSRGASTEDIKEHFAVWRRVEEGTFSTSE